LKENYLFGDEQLRLKGKQGYCADLYEIVMVLHANRTYR
jgi:hypothetical protein